MLTKLLLLKCIICLAFTTTIHGRELKELHFELANSSQMEVAVVIPFAKGALPLKSILALESETDILNVKAGYHLLWPGTDFIRAINLTFKPSSTSSRYRLFWRNSAFELEHRLPLNRVSEIHLDKRYLHTIGYGQKHIPQFEYSWFSHAFEQFANYVTTPTLIEQNRKQKLNYDHAAPWLYDHPYTLYMLHLRTGELKWKELAHQKAIKYRESINDRGYFGLKERSDLKYLMAPGLVLDYMFYPNKKTRKVVAKIHKNGLLWHQSYKDSLSFWTERNLSNALGLAISQWELNADISAQRRVDELIQGLQSSMIKTGKGSCALHEYRDHEGKGDDTKVCSLWMSALVVEQLWKYRYLTDSKKADEVIIALADHAIENGIYFGSNTHLKGFHIPKYLYFAERSKYQKDNQWTDIHHACDVAGMILKSQYIKKVAGLDFHYGREQVKGLLKTCKKTLSRSKKVKVWQISPLRKFNWWFSSTANLEWLLTELDY